MARQDLAFRQQAEAAFEFLRSEFGFRLLTATDTFLRYETDQVFVNVYHGRSSYELRFEIGLLVAPESKYYPEEVAALAGATEATYFQASTADRVSMLLPRLADVLHRHCSNLLTGDPTEFDKLQDVRNRLADADHRKYQLISAREKADMAWKRRDYRAVVEALNIIDRDMSPAECRKLQYALEKLGQIQ